MINNTYPGSRPVDTFGLSIWAPRAHPSFSPQTHRHDFTGALVRTHANAAYAFELGCSRPRSCVGPVSITQSLLNSASASINNTAPPIVIDIPLIYSLSIANDIGPLRPPTLKAELSLLAAAQYSPRNQIQVPSRTPLLQDVMSWTLSVGIINTGRSS